MIKVILVKRESGPSKEQSNVSSEVDGVVKNYGNSYPHHIIDDVWINFKLALKIERLQKPGLLLKNNQGNTPK